MSSLRVGKRVSNKVLLGSDFQEVVTKVYNPPAPLETIEAYTVERVCQGLAYADSVLRNPTRKLSPLGQIALGMYEDSCARYLDIEEREIVDEVEVSQLKTEWLATIRDHEKSLQLMSCLRLTKTTDAQQLQDSLVQMMRTQFFARYGDHFSHVSTQLKNYEDANKVRGWHALTNAYWAEIAQNLRDVATDYAKVSKGESTEEDKVPTHLAVRESCRAIGFNFRDTLAVISHYATRNELMHANLVPLIKEGSLTDLGKLLHKDLCSLPLLLPPSDKEDYNVMYSLLETIIDTWFVRPQTQPDRDNPGLWNSLPKLFEYREDLNRKTSKDITKVTKDMSNHITNQLTKHMQRFNGEELVRGQVAIVEEIGMGGGFTLKRKRVSSAQFQAERVKLKKRLEQDPASKLPDVPMQQYLSRAMGRSGNPDTSNFGSKP